MCVVSMVGDHYADKWRDKIWVEKEQPFRIYPIDIYPATKKPDGCVPLVPVSREEFDQLKRDVEEMKALLKRAKKYDEENNEPDCEIEQKMELLRRVAEAVGVDLCDVIGKGK